MNKIIEQLANKYIVIVAFSVINAVVGALWTVVAKWEYLWLIFLILAISAGVFLWQWLKLREISKDQILLSNVKCISADPKRYSIILIDDDSDLRTRYKMTFINAYDIAVIDNLDSIRYLFGFDIIIIDLVKTASFNRDSSLDLIKMLKQEKPYKYIIAISSDHNKLAECNGWVNASIYKEDHNKIFEGKLRAEIDKAFQLLDDPQRYWDNHVINNKMYYKEKNNGFYESDYINTIKQNPHFGH